MINLTLIICLILSLIIAYLVMVKPLFIDKAAAYDQIKTEIKEFDPSLSLLETITELETDYKMGKLSKEDFEALSLEYKRIYLEQQNKKET